MQSFPFPLRCSLMALCAAVVMTVLSPSAYAIVGGELDGNRHPNVGAFVLTRLIKPIPGVNKSVPDACGSGTLIHPRVVVVAGHGTWFVEQDLAAGYYTLDDLKFSFGANALDPTTWLDIEAVVTHPDYDPKLNTGGGATPLADVGLVILKEPVHGVTPATLAPEGFLDCLDVLDELDGTKLTVVGYGNYGDAPNKLLFRDGQRRVAQSEFLMLQDRWLFLDQNPAHGNGGTASCDSGGPTFWKNPDTGEEILVSITSRGDAAVVATGITYRTDTAEALDFIDFVIAVVDQGWL